MKLPKLQSVDLNAKKKKKILLLSDDLRMSSGVGTMSREFVMGSVHHYDWVQIGGAITHPENGKRVDMNEAIKEELGIDGSLIIYPTNGYGEWYKVADGVTSNLCLHGIDHPMESFLSRGESIDPPINYGGASDQSAHRGTLGAGIEYLSRVPGVSIEDLTDLADSDLQLGALGIHQQPEYTIGVTEEEMIAHGVVAAEYGVPLCLHLRSGDTENLSNQEEAVEEALSVAEETGCRIHIEHLNSTGGTSRMSEAIEQIESARSRGLSITACTYPYSYWATYAGTSRFDNFEEKFGITYND